MPLIQTPWALTEKEKQSETVSYWQGNPTLDEIFEIDAMVTYAEAKEEIAQHHLDGDFYLFLREYGTKEQYLGKDVLIWLGY